MDENTITPEAFRRIVATTSPSEARIRRAFPFDGLRRMTFANDDGRFGASQMERCRKYAKRLVAGARYGLLLFGPPDSGKTYASACIANSALDSGMSVMMRSVPWLMGDVDLDPLVSCDLLVLDDFGAERDTSYGRERIYAIVDARYQSRRPMVVSTNLTRQQLYHAPDMASMRTCNRLLEVCFPLEFDTGRKRATKERYQAMLDDMDNN